MIDIKQQRSGKAGGRPRIFDEGTALRQAMRVFWKKGYEGASLADLTKAMGLHPPSLYRAFGDKEELFWKVMERYGEGPAAYVADCLHEPTAFAVVAKRLRCAVDVMSDPRHPWGCLATQAAVTCGDAGQSVRKKLIAIRAGSQAALRARFARAKDEGDLPKNSNPAALASYVSTLVLGISMQAASGMKREELLGIVENTLRTWPALVQAAK
jgi:AcrR family transcriptional regulator